MYSTFKWSKRSLSRNRITRAYEPLQPFVFVELAKRFPATIFIDVGSNIGAYAVFATTAPSLSEIHAYEAAPAAFSELRENVRINALGSKVNCINLAVSSNRGVIEFEIAGAISGANCVATTSIHKNKIAETITVKAAPLDAEFTYRGQRIAVKVDVEGHEPEVLRGSRSLLTNNKVLLQIENYAVAGNEIAEDLSSIGYSNFLQLGPDQYFTNDPACFSDATVIDVIQRAAAVLIEDSKSADFSRSDGTRPIRRRLAAGALTLEISGTPAALLRKTKRFLCNRRNAE